MAAIPDGWLDPKVELPNDGADVEWLTPYGRKVVNGTYVDGQWVTDRVGATAYTPRAYRRRSLVCSRSPVCDGAVEVVGKYAPVSVEVAREIAERHGKAIVCIMAWDQARGLFHVTSYGRSVAEQAAAGRIGEKLMAAARKAIGWEALSGQGDERVRAADGGGPCGSGPGLGGDPRDAAGDAG